MRLLTQKKEAFDHTDEKKQAKFQAKLKIVRFSHKYKLIQIQAKKANKDVTKRQGYAPVLARTMVDK